MDNFLTKQLWSHINAGDLSAVHTMLESANVNLEERDEVRIVLHTLVRDLK